MSDPSNRLPGRPRRIGTGFVPPPMPPPTAPSSAAVEGVAPIRPYVSGVAPGTYLLRDGDAQFVRKLRRGVILILSGFAFVLVAYAAANILSLFKLPVVVLVVFLVAMLIGAVLLVIGTWLLTARDPAGHGERQYGWARKFIRVALLTGVAVGVLRGVTVALTLSGAMRSLADGVGALSYLLSAAANVVQLHYLSLLAMRIPDQKLSDRSTKLMWATGWIYGLLILILVSAVVAAVSDPRSAAVELLWFAAMFVGVCAFVVALLYLLVLDKFAKRFKREVDAHAQEKAHGSQSVGLVGS